MRAWFLLLVTWAAAAAQQAGIFTDTYVHEIRLHMYPSDWNALTTHYQDNTFYPADFEWQGVLVPDAAVRSRGLGSRNPTKPGLLVSFDRYVPGRRELGVTALVLDNSYQDTSFLRERLSMLLFARAGLPAPRESYARVFVNGELMGLYVVAEDIGRAFLERTFEGGDGRLYEYKWIFDWRFQPLSDKLDPYLQVFEPRSHLRERDRPELLALVNAINSSPGQGYSSRVGQVINLQQYLRYLAVEHYLGEWDGQAGTEGINNFYLYWHGVPARFSFIPWDKDVTLARQDFSPIRAAADFPLLNGLFQDPEISREYGRVLAATAALAGGSGGFMDTEARRLLAMIRTAALEDPRKPASNDTFEESSESVLQYINQRVTVIFDELDALHLR